MTHRTPMRPSYLGFSNKEMKFQNNRATLVQNALLLISQPRSQNQSVAFDWRE